MDYNLSKPLPPLLLCVILDIVGMLSFTVPLIGEFSDVVWAPLSGIIYFSIFGGKMGKIGGVFSFIEEIIPFTDVIPTFTISWFLKDRAMKQAAKNEIYLKN